MIAVLFDGEPPLCLFQMTGGYELLRALHLPVAANEPIPSRVSDQRDRATWNRLLDEFRVSNDFTQRASDDFARFDAASAQGERVVDGSLWVQKASYPLSVFAMVLVVVGFGHLLNNRPKVDAADMETKYWSSQRRVVAQSLLIIGLLSAIDLIWTIGTANAGLMRELNPVGSALIHEPVRLFLFKGSVTAMSIAILYWLHRRPFAQMASWWSCLLLTLLTARWVVFQSMFL